MPRPSVADALFDAELGCGFDPFEAARLLELLANEDTAVDSARPWRGIDAAVQFRANVTLGFPPSLVAQVLPPRSAGPPDDATLTRTAAAIRRRYADRRTELPVLVTNFFGLFGPNGALPLVYTRTLCELDADPAYRRTSTRAALRDWLDLFNNRLTGHLFRAWQKYRMPVGYLRAGWRKPAGVSPPPDRVSEVLFSVIGLGTPAHRGRLAVRPWAAGFDAPPALAAIDDRGLLKYAGALARRRPGAGELRAILADVFGLPVRIDTLTGQWLDLPAGARTRCDGRAALGVNAVAGDRVWDTGSKFRIRVGPVRYEAFVAFLPDPLPVTDRKGVHLLSQLTRLYVGPELDFEVQLVLFKHAVPDCVMQDVTAGDLGLRLGWNTWLTGDGLPDEVDDMRFDGPCETEVG